MSDKETARFLSIVNQPQKPQNGSRGEQVRLWDLSTPKREFVHTRALPGSLAVQAYKPFVGKHETWFPEASRLSKRRYLRALTRRKNGVQNGELIKQSATAG